MKIVSKKQAMNMQIDSLFKSIKGKTLNISKFDNGKYKWHGSVNHFLGLDVPDIKGVHAVYPERRKDKNGPYTQLMCVHE